MEHGSAMILSELDAEGAELLPIRETLCIDINVAPVIAVNMAFAINAGSIGASATAMANQSLYVLQVGP